MTYFVSYSTFNLFFFFVILFHIERKWLFMRNFATILPLKSKLSGRFQSFNAIDRSIEMLKIKMKNCKAFCKAQTASRLNEIIQSFFTGFCWLWDFLLESLKLKKHLYDVHWNFWTNIKMFYARNNIVKKRIPNIKFWIIYILVQISFFGGLP